MYASQLSSRGVHGIALEVVPTESVIPREMTDESLRGQPFGRKRVPLSIHKVTWMEATFVDQVGKDGGRVARVV